MGRDRSSLPLPLLACSFNSRARVGRDMAAFRTSAIAGGFQLTRPRGARRDKVAADDETKEFQLTRPRGARLYT